MELSSDNLERLKQPLFHTIPLKPNQVLVSRKKHPRIYHERIHKLFFSMGHDEVYVQAVGASIEYAVNLALDVEAKYSEVELDVDTFTMPITDELLDSESGESVKEQHRLNSGVLIKITKKS